MSEFVYNHIIKPLVVGVNPNSTTVFNGKIHRKCGFTLTFQLIRGNRAVYADYAQNMRVVIRCLAVVWFRAAAFFAIAARQAPRRGRMLRLEGPEWILSCGLHKNGPWLGPLAKEIHSSLAHNVHDCKIRARLPHKPARRGCGCKTAASCPCSILPGLRCARGARQNGGGHTVNDGHFSFFTVSLLKIHFVFLLSFVQSTIYKPNSTMRRWKIKYG